MFLLSVTVWECFTYLWYLLLIFVGLCNPLVMQCTF